jgi:hypothetical protein
VLPLTITTISNNLPLRLLKYIASTYEKIVNRKKLYHTKLEKIPAPEFIVLYNGSAPYSDYTELRLSDAFQDIEGLKSAHTIPLELIAHVYNINQGHNAEILKKCETLDNYSVFIDKIREYQKQQTLDESVKLAVKYCTENDILKKFLDDNGSEVLNMLLDWNTEDAIEAAREEGLEDGIEKGREDGIEFAARNALAKGISVQTVQEITGLDLGAIEAIKQRL